mmetsp:Transcript_42903/g.31335  ORF Transcript_42903/g.31335 Transcript_42903/m.31335 type:complete len:104 (-) Transcript_42903:380-691(-)
MAFASLIEVVPFYMTWLILSLIFLKDDRKKTKMILFLFSFGFGYMEYYIKCTFGDPDQMMFINLILSFLPSKYTIAENLMLLRSMFPLFYQLIILILDYTIER